MPVFSAGDPLDIVPWPESRKSHIDAFLPLVLAGS